MPSASEVRSRIEGIQETKKITDAMYMISSAKMQKALRSLSSSTPYFEALAARIGELVQLGPQSDNRYFQKPRSAAERVHGILLITSDKGLAGAYNQEAIRVCQGYMQKHARCRVFILGEYGRQTFLNQKLDFEKSFHFSASAPSLPLARQMSSRLLTAYRDDLVDDIHIIYTDYMGNTPGVCRELTLLPLSRTSFPVSGKAAAEREFVPSYEEVLNGVIPAYLTGFVYGCLVESYCSEQQARMNAMKSASDNAESLLKELKTQYNKLRQSAITNEMIEIAAGAQAQKRKRQAAAGGKEDAGTE